MINQSPMIAHYLKGEDMGKLPSRSDLRRAIEGCRYHDIDVIIYADANAKADAHNKALDNAKTKNRKLVAMRKKLVKLYAEAEELRKEIGIIEQIISDSPEMVTLRKAHDKEKEAARAYSTTWRMYMSVLSGRVMVAEITPELVEKVRQALEGKLPPEILKKS